MLCVHFSEEFRKRRGVFSGQGPKYAAGSQVATKQAEEKGEEAHEEEAESAAGGVCGLAVDGGEGEEVGAGEDGVEVGDAVEDGDEVGEGCDEADDELGEDGFRDVFTWSGIGLVYVECAFHYCLSLLFGRIEYSYLGISSARWETTSGVPTAKAPFNIPRRNTNSSLL